ncbi:MAG: hypothetical protein GY852_06785, partial [bacterium]|nr:hypothetical protein [bacterium]
ISREEREANHAMQLHNNVNLLQSLHILIQDREYKTFLELLHLIKQKCLEEANAPRKRVNFATQSHEMQVLQLLSMDGTISKVAELASLEIEN